MTLGSGMRRLGAFLPLLRAEAQTTTSCHFDCQAGLNNWRAAWADAKKEYCCKHEHIACESPVTTTSCHFDCAAGVNNWRAAWAQPKKQWCCTHENVACEDDAPPTAPLVIRAAEPPAPAAPAPATTTTSCRYDCQEGLNNWRMGWAPQKIEYCCKHENVACPDTTTTSCHFDCSAGFNNWKAAWAPQKKEYCCRYEKVACPETTTSKPFDCAAGLSQWKATWAPQKQEYCCKHENAGCPETTTSSPFDCTEGISNWQSGWAPPKKEYCCKHQGVGCPATTTSSQFDCREGINDWRMGWAPAKKEYCCKHENVACPETTVATTPATTTVPAPSAPLPRSITTCKLSCWGDGARPVSLPGSVGVGGGASLNDVSLDSCRRACAATAGCDAVMYTNKTEGVPFKSMCYGKREVHTDKCQLGGSYITEILGSHKRVMGKCAIFGDPHVISFDRIFGPPTTIIEPGVFHLIKSPQLSVHGRFGYTKRFPTASSAVGVAVGGPLLKDHKLVVAYIGPEKGYKGFKVLWDSQPILEEYPSTFTASDGALVAKHDAMDPQDYHREGRHTIGGTEGRLPSYHFKLGVDLSIYVLIGPDNCNVVIEAARQPEGQDGWCGNFNCDQDDDSHDALRTRGMTEQVPIAENLFNGSPPPPAWVMKKVEPPSLKECAPSVKAAAEAKCAHLPNGEKESCIFDACAAEHAQAQIVTDTEAPEVRQGNQCDAPCEFEGKAVSCRDRIMWTTKHQFANLEDACHRGLDLVRAQCQGACDACTAVELADCGDGLHLHFFQRFESVQLQLLDHAPVPSLSVLAMAASAVATGLFIVYRLWRSSGNRVLVQALE